MRERLCSAQSRLEAVLRSVSRSVCEDEELNYLSCILRR